VLRVGLTGGIGAGKSSVSGQLIRRGAVVIDADRLAREVVAPGTPGLDAVVRVFGPGVLAEDGSLDRPKLAGVVFADADALTSLNGIVHPLVARRTAELVADAPADAVVVHDVPLLVENGLAPGYHLVVVVQAPVDKRIARLAASRAMSEQEARSRIAAQATDEQRSAAADVVLDNGGTPAELQAAVDSLWSARLVPYEENVRLRRPADPAGADPLEPAGAVRVVARLRLALGDSALRVEPTGPGLEVVVADGTAADDVAGRLADAGFPPWPGESGRRHGSADPGCPVTVSVRWET
jgi:dephospho-CoA kinase